MHIYELCDPDNLEQRIADGYIAVQQHPELDLYLYCYTTKAQLEWQWDNETMLCRGLITDGEGRIVARPFKKFGTYEQHLTWAGGTLPQGHFQAYEKLDGSLGIMYPRPLRLHTGQTIAYPQIATKGSFGSEQAEWASNWIQRWEYDNGVGLADLFDMSMYTYLFEIIYPENRVVVDYGDRAEVVLLDVLETATGARAHAEFQRIEATGWPTVQPVQIDYKVLGDQATLYQQVPDDKEGFVLVYDNGVRIKVKGERYLELHRLVATEVVEAEIA